MEENIKKQGITRRDALKAGLSGIAGASLSGLINKNLQAKTRPAKAKAVIQIWMWGGPTHTDTFDPKPNAGYDYTGPYDKAIPTNVNGIQIGQMLPLLAKQADKYSIIRSMTHGIKGHETASYMVQTGREQGKGMVFPSVGAVVSLKKGYDAGYKGLLPPYIVATRSQGRFSEAGFLGPKYKPFATGGDPNKKIFEVEGIVTPGVTPERQRSRRDLLYSLDTLGNKMKNEDLFKKTDLCREQAYDMILGETGKVFDLSQEKEDLRTKYGKSTFGQSCLLARRLVEKGVKYVTINYKGWDTHKGHFQSMQKKLPELDKGFSTLLQDLSDRGLLDSTIVWWGGEFGRTPKIKWEAPWNGGRGHYGDVFSFVVAGGGFKPGQVVGSSDAKSEQVKDRPVYPWDFIGTIYELLGIDPNGTLPHPRGISPRLTLTKADGIKVGGRLKEIT